MDDLDQRIRENAIEGKLLVALMEKIVKARESKPAPKNPKRRKRNPADSFWVLNTECEKRMIISRFLKAVRRESREEYANPIRFLHREMVKLSADLESAAPDSPCSDRTFLMSGKTEIEIKLAECHSMIERLAG